MMTHIHTAQIYVTDYEKALAFFTDKLGWEKREDAPLGDDARWLTVAIPGTTTGISLAGPGMHGEHTPGGYTGINIISDDIAADYDRLVAAGVAFTAPPERMPWGDMATWFTDQDANQFYLLQPGSPA